MYMQQYRENHCERILERGRRYYYTRRCELGSCLLEGMTTDARPSRTIDVTGGGWLLCKYRLQPLYLRENFACLNRLAPPSSPSCASLSDLSKTADRLDELLLRASPAGSSSIASEVVAELDGLLPPPPEPV